MKTHIHSDATQTSIFSTVLKTYKWHLINNCPGRYRLKEKAGKTLSPSQLVGRILEETELISPNTQDPIIVAEFPDQSGGLLSYKKSDGTFVHTLNTPSGFKRKLLDY